MQYYIARKMNVYGSQREFYRLGSEPQSYASRAEAERAIKEEEQSIYYAAHGECGHPDRKVVSDSQLTKSMRNELRFASFR